jgi:protein involved in polysaccharide export with SLBB domain
MRSAISKVFVKVVLFFTLFIAGFTATAQPPIEIPQGIPANIDPKNLSQPQLRALLEDQNQDAGKDKNADLYKNNKIEKDSVVQDDIKGNAYSPKKTYGANVFAYSATTDLSELSTPPLDYPIGVGDHIIVSLWGGSEIQEDYVVARDGSIFPTSLGKISVQGLTFDNMRSVVYSRFRSVVPAGTNISVSLGQPRSINVNVVGEVKRAGPITVSAFSNAFNVIARAGGVTEFGNLRSIVIKRNGRQIDEIDVYKYLNTGDFGKHIYLQNNDFVIVGFMEKKVLATGQFKRPMYYQLKKDEGVKALIKYAGGLNSEALASALKIIRTQDEKQVQIDVNANAILKIEGQDASLMDGDVVKVNLVKAGIINKVEIRGEITYPDTYELRQGDRLFDLINRAGGVTRNTYLPRAYVFRGAGDSTNLQSDRLEVDLTSLNEGNELTSASNIVLQTNDVVQLFSQNEFGEQQFVEIYGEVRKEGKVTKYGGMTLEDLLYLSGGIKPTAEFGRLEISSVVDVDSARKSLKPTRTVVRSYSVLPNLRLDSAASKIILRPFDQIFVRKNPTFELQQNIELKGMVQYPGLYPRLSKYERISSYLERAGGVQENANLAGAVLFRKKTDLFREKIVEVPVLDSFGIPIKDSLSEAFKAVDEPVTIDLYKAIKYKNSKHDIVLQEQDVVFIPEINPFVTIKGRVQSPLKIAFDKEHNNLMYYIDKAGGFGVKPWRKRIYVTYANGKSRRTKNFLFMHFYPRVSEGAIVTVPQRPETQDAGDIIKTVLVGSIPVILTGIIFKYIN